MDEIAFDAYLPKLTQMLAQTFLVDSGKVDFQIDMPELNLSIDIANPLGLVLNELISNSLEYAFPGNQAGTVTINSQVGDRNVIELIVADNDIGMPEEFDWDNFDSLGLRLVKDIVEKQPGGTIEYQYRNGCCFTIKFSTVSDYV